MGDLPFVAEQYEAENYYTLAYQDPSAIEQEWGFRWRYILRRIVELYPGARVLDVGAGNGYFVFLARKEFGLHADGVEISEAEIAFAREKFGVRLLKQPLSELAGGYDVVTSFNVLEHVKEPWRLLREMAETSAPDGVLVLTTPNPGCVHRRMKGLRRWGMVDPPHHINLFPRAALAHLLREAEFVPVAYETLSTYIRFVRRYDTRGLLFRRMLFRALQMFNLGADHLFIARRVPRQGRRAAANRDADFRTV